jgi:hypothetical protein
VKSPASVRPRAPKARLLAVLALAAATSATVAACGSSSAAPKVSASSSAAALSQDCTAVSDVLADGPDPTADSVGYAEAQILPLKQLNLTVPAVRSAVDQLDAAFSAFAAATGPAQVQAAVKVSTAQDAVNKLCPGAAS